MKLIGEHIMTTVQDGDEGPDGQERIVDVGSIGCICARVPGTRLYHIAWENGASTLWTRREIERDSRQVITRPWPVRKGRVS